jgi:hypothetical protein
LTTGGAALDNAAMGRAFLIAAAAALFLLAPALADEAVEVRAPVGYFALQPGDPMVLQGKRLVTDQQLALPKVAGLTIRARWAWLHPQGGKFDFSFIDSQVARCRRLKKPYKLLVMTGRESAPRWISGEWYLEAPVPWSPQLAEQYGALVAELGKRYASDPLLVGVHITGPTFPSAEMHPARGIAGVKGFSLKAMSSAWAASIDDYAKAFPETACILSISVQPPADRYLSEVVAYGRSKLGPRLTLQHNALKASTNPLAPHQLFIASAAKQGVRVGFEMVSAAANQPQRFGSRDVMDGVKLGKAIGGVYFDIYPPDLESLR